MKKGSGTLAGYLLLKARLWRVCGAKIKRNEQEIGKLEIWVDILNMIVEFVGPKQMTQRSTFAALMPAAAFRGANRNPPSRCLFTYLLASSRQHLVS